MRTVCTAKFGKNPHKHTLHALFQQTPILYTILYLYKEIAFRRQRKTQK